MIQNERIGCTPGAGLALVAQFIAQCQQRAEGKPALVQVDRDVTLIEAVGRGVLDYAVVHAPADLDTDEFTYMPVGMETLIVAARSSHVFVKEPPDVMQLMSSNWGLPMIDDPLCMSFRKALLDLGLNLPDRAIHASHVTAAIDLALSMDMLVLLPMSTSQRMIQEGRLSNIQLPFALPSVPYGVIYRRPDTPSLPPPRIGLLEAMRENRIAVGETRLFDDR